MNKISASANIVSGATPVRTEPDFCEPNTVTEVSQAAASQKMNVETSADKATVEADQTQALKLVGDTQMIVAEVKQGIKPAPQYNQIDANQPLGKRKSQRIINNHMASKMEKQEQRIARLQQNKEPAKDTSVDKSKSRESEIDPSDPYKKIRCEKNKTEENIVCDVCLDGDDDEGDEILICDLCQTAVHQTCYGGELLDSIPQGNWYCARCQELINNPQKKCTEIQCMFCPKIDGIMKSVTIG